MANPEQHPIPQEAGEREQPTPFEIATAFSQTCNELTAITDHETTAALHEKLFSLVEQHAQGTDFIIKGVKRDMHRYGSNPGQRPIDNLPDQLEIDLEREEYGVFSPQGAQKYERNQLTFLIPGELRPRAGFPSANHQDLKQLHSDWTAAYEEHYGEQVNNSTTIFLNSRSSYSK